MRIYVTGIAGFLGREVARQLVGRRHVVGGCDNYSTSTPRDLAPLVRVAPAALQEYVPPNIERYDVVVHCAAIARSTWPNEDELWEHNVVATKAVLDWGVPVIFASSSVVGIEPTTTYARTKAVAERLVRGAGGMALRFSNIYGPGQSEDDSVTVPNVLAAFRRQRAATGCLRVDGDGTQTRHWVHVTDAAAAVVAAVNNPLAGMWLDICGERAPLGALAHRFGCPVGYGPARPNDPHDMDQDPAPAKALLGWEPKIGLDEGLAEVVARP